MSAIRGGDGTAPTDATTTQARFAHTRAFASAGAPTMFEVEPGKGAGPFVLAVSRTHIERVLGRFGRYTDYRSSPESPVSLFSESPSLKIGLALRDERVEYVEFTHGQASAADRELCPDCRRRAVSTVPPCSYIVTLLGLDVFHTPADELLEAVGDEGFEDTEEGMTWVTRKLQVAFWREDPELPFFQSVTVGGSWCMQARGHQSPRPGKRGRRERHIR